MSITELRDVLVEDLVADADNPRTELKDLDDLAASMREVGLLQPVVARDAGGQLVVVAGHRRLAAARIIGWTTVPCIVRPAMRPDEVLVAMLVENNQRADLDPIEEARAFQKLKSDHGWTDAQVGQHVGRSQPAVSARLALTYLTAGQQEDVRTGALLVRDAVVKGRAAAGRTRRSDALTGWHFGRDHHLASRARAACLELKHPRSRQLAATACGECWEAVIRDDERRARARTHPGGSAWKTSGSTTATDPSSTRASGDRRVTATTAATGRAPTAQVVPNRPGTARPADTSPTGGEPASSTSSRNPSSSAPGTSGAAHATATSTRPTPKPRPTTSPASTSSSSGEARIVPLATRRVFDDVEWMAAAGTALAEIVLATEMPPPRLRELYARYERAMPSVLQVVS